jgi:hypothetical protein
VQANQKPRRGQEGSHPSICNCGSDDGRSDRAARAQSGDRGRIVAERVQHGVGMLALLGRRRAQLPRRAAQIHRLAEQLLASMRGARDRARDADVPHLWVGEYLVDAIDWAAGNAGAVENLNPLCRRAGAGDRLDRRIELVAIAQSRLAARVGRIGGELFGAERLAQPSEQLRARARDIDVSVGGRENAGRNRGRMVVAGLLRHFSREQPSRRLKIRAGCPSRRKPRR